MELSSFWFVTYKVVKYLIYPYTWLIILLGILLLLVLRRASVSRFRWVRVLVILTFLPAYALATPLVSGYLIGTLEERHPLFDQAHPRPVEAIVVLAGGILPKGSLRPTDELTGASITRTLCGVDLYTRGFSAQLILSGGDTSLLTEGPQEAMEMQRLAMRLGVPSEAIVTETRSRTTYESAVEIKRLLGTKSVLLVTSASHMPRALSHFLAEGIRATAAPCGYAAKERAGHRWNNNPLDLVPNVESLQRSTYAINERVGVLVYRAIGKL